MSLQQAIFPSQWKRANVSPVFKNNKLNEVKNYRPISLFCVISKCMERCIYKHVYNHLLQNKKKTVIAKLPNSEQSYKGKK